MDQDVLPLIHLFGKWVNRSHRLLRTCRNKRNCKTGHSFPLVKECYICKENFHLCKLFLCFSQDSGRPSRGETRGEIPRASPLSTVSPASPGQPPQLPLLPLFELRWHACPSCEGCSGRLILWACRTHVDRLVFFSHSVSCQPDRRPATGPEMGRRKRPLFSHEISVGPCCLFCACAMVHMVCELPGLWPRGAGRSAPGRLL